MSVTSIKIDLTNQRMRYVNPTARLVFAYIDAVASTKAVKASGGWAEISVDKFAETLHISQAAVKDALRTLEKEWLINKQPGVRNGARNSCNKYRIIGRQEFERLQQAAVPRDSIIAKIKVSKRLLTEAGEHQIASLL